ncbi:MAG: uncharacterized protein JWN98_2018 [Abditibacteriota bacterium]|nr:uncharacterized protein [Abditibacteriota bacterium]
MQWYNEPPAWETNGQTIRVSAGAKTDFWRKTHYGFIRDDGHFYYQPVEGDFKVEVKVTGHYHTLYDQAGLMVRLDQDNWLKCGIEFVDGIQQASAVVTRDYSDWSMQPLSSNPASLWLRLTRRGDAIEIHYSLDSATYTLLRLTYLTLSPTVDVGLMCAAPDGDGFDIEFEAFSIQLLPAT